MAIFQPRPMQIPNLRTDYSAENSAAQGLADWASKIFPEMRKQQIEGQKQQLLSSLTSGNPDYTKVGLGLLAAGDTTGGAAVLGLAQKQQQLGAQRGISDLFSGGGGGSSASPSTSGAGPASLIQNESGGRWDAQNDAVGSGGQVGHFGRAQFGQARLQDAANAGAIPQGTTPEQFKNSPELQKKAEAWHFGDIDNFIQANGYDKLIGQQINGVPITVDGMRAVAHLGGTGGLRNFIESGGKYNPSDRNGTSLMDYFGRHQGNSTPLAPPIQIANPTGAAPVQAQAPAAAPPQVQVAENEADVQRLESRMPGYGGAPAQVAQAPAQPAADAPAPGAAPAQFAVPGNMLPPNDPAPRATNQQLMGVISNPNATDGQRQLANTILSNRLKYADENAPDKREQSRLTTEKLRREVQGEGATPLTAEERTAFGVPQDQAAYKTRSGEIKFGPAGTKVSVDQRGETEEAKAIGQAAGKRAGEMMAAAAGGSKQLQRIGQLESLLKNIESGRLQPGRMNMAALGKSLGVNEDFLKTIGLDPTKVGDAQAVNAITGRMVVDMIGSGGFPANNFSDADRAFITGTVPSLANDPRGNKIIMEAAKRTAQIDIEKAKSWREWRKENKGGSFDDFEVQWNENLGSKDRFSDLAKQAEAITGPLQPTSNGWQDMGGGIRIRQRP